MRVFLCSDTYLLRSCDRHAVCFCAERSGAANSSFSRLGCTICIAIAARSHPTERPLVPKLLLGQLWCLSSRSKPTRKIWVIDQRDLIRDPFQPDLAARLFFQGEDFLE